ncbi:MAG: metallophosphatase [Cyclobacteriaceae bacterium]|nr:metallophosphatase [Cyclobacteriaceae bacterium]
MRRRQFIQQVALSSAAAFIPSAPLWASAEHQKLTILHTNDMHSRIDPFPNDGGRFAGMGGMARRAQIIKQIRASEKNVLLLDAGDIFQGTPYFNLFEGELEFKLMSQMKYDASTLGNHDFDNGLAGLEKQLPHAEFPFIIANYDFNGTSLNGRFNPYKIFHIEDIKVGVFGLGIELKGLVNEKLYGATRYLDPLGVAREMVEELRAQECHLIICLSHLGYQYTSDKVSDVVLASEVSGIDLVIGGHTHTFLEEPTMITNKEGYQVIVNQVGFAGINLGRIDFNITKGSTNFFMKSKTVKVNN